MSYIRNLSGSHKKEIFLFAPSIKRKEKLCGKLTRKLGYKIGYYEKVR